MTADPGLKSSAEARYETYSSQASTVVRTLALAAIAVCWLFAGGLSPAASTPKTVLEGLTESRHLLDALRWAVISIALDVAQYAWAALTLGMHQWTVNQIVTAKGPRVRPREWIAWRLAWLSRLLNYLGYAVMQDRIASATLAHPAGDLPKGLGPRIAELRSALQEGTGPQLHEAVCATWSPPVINLVTAGLFIAKLLAALFAYKAVAMFLEIGWGLLF